MSRKKAKDELEKKEGSEETGRGRGRGRKEEQEEENPTTARLSAISPEMRTRSNRGKQYMHALDHRSERSWDLDLYFCRISSTLNGPNLRNCGGSRRILRVALQ